MWSLYTVLFSLSWILKATLQSFSYLWLLLFSKPFQFSLSHLPNLLTLLIYIQPHREEKKERAWGLIEPTLAKVMNELFISQIFPWLVPSYQSETSSNATFSKSPSLTSCGKVILLFTLAPRSVSFPYRMYHEGRELSCPVHHTPQQ